MSSGCITSTTIACAGQHSFYTCLRCTWYRGCRPTHQFRFNVGPALQPIAGSMPVNRLRHWSSTNLSPGLLYTLRNTCHSTNTVSMLTHSLRRWQVIEIALGDWTVFSDCWIMLVTFKIPAAETPDNTIHWSNADVMLGHRLQHWANIIPTRTL